MEHVYENQQPDEPLAHDEYIQNLGRASSDPRVVLEEVKQFGRDFAHDEAASKEVIGQLLCGALDIPEEMMDDASVKGAERMLLFGAMTALYVGNGMTDGAMTNRDVLGTASELMKDSPQVLLNDAEKFIHSMDPNSRAVLDRWKSALNGGNADEPYFDTGFGAMMCSVNKTIYEINLFRDFEKSMNWRDSNNEKPSPVALISLDEDCLRLAQAFEGHTTALGLRNKSGEDLKRGLEDGAKFLEQDLVHLEDLQIDDQVQTRGLGICINFDETGEPDEVIEYDEDVKIRGHVIGMQCMLVPTEFALFMGLKDGDDIYEPQVCLILENVEDIELDGDVTPREGISAIPLRTSGTSLDKVIYQTDQS